MTKDMQWTVGTCVCRGCVMTLVAPAGAGQTICWLHALMLGLPVAPAAVERVMRVVGKDERHGH